MNKIQIRDKAFERAAAGHTDSNPFSSSSWQGKAWADGDMQGREVTLHRIRAEARELARKGGVANNTYPLYSEQHKAYTLGWYEGQVPQVFCGISGKGDTLAPFPPRMPAPTREHLKRLNAEALSTKCSSRALRLDNKIQGLYQRYA
jgi:hypothetical protein